VKSFFSPTPWFRLSLSVVRLGLEVQALIGLRLFRIATGGVAALPETARMVPEKAAALAEANRIVALGAASGRSDQSCAKVVRMYRKRVGANRTRLRKPVTRKQSTAPGGRT
jgi:hypothetical protein